jgi:hypothetical protein
MGSGISDVAADGGGKVGMAVGGYLSPSLCLSLVALTSDAQRFRHGQHWWTWRDGRGGFEVWMRWRLVIRKKSGVLVLFF